MLKNIESNFFIRLIFFHIKEELKLKIVKYNKSLQDIIDINIINYKIFSGRYIIEIGDGKVREYDYFNYCLKYEGEYLNKKRFGKGKEYSYDYIIFEGEFLKGKRNGRGKEYIDNNLIFEGIYLNGKKWTGKGYDSKNNFIYELKDGKGIIKEFDNFDNSLQFEGEYLNGEKNGKGKEYDYEGNIIFEGEYFNGKKWNGKGYDINHNVIYILKDGSGLIKEFDTYLLKYEGKYLDGEKNGEGKEYDSDGKLLFEGEYSNGKRNGKGKQYYNGILIFEGNYLYGHKTKGKEYIEKRLEYEGEYLFDRKYNGKGYDEKGNVIYELKNGKGNVKEYDSKGILKFEGEYYN